MNARVGAAVATALSLQDKRERRGTPAFRWHVLIGVLVLECYLAIGAAIWQAIERDTRSGDFGQPDVNYISSFYFVLVTFATVGFGDIVCTNNRSRGFIFCWGMVGVTFMSVILVVVVKNFIRLSIFYARQFRQSQLRQIRASASGLDVIELPPTTTAERRDEERQVAEYGEKVLLWVLLAAFASYFAYLAIGAAILKAIESSLGNLPPEVTPNTFGNYFYFWWVATASIGYGTDYSPKSDSARLFFIFYVQLGMVLHVFLFSNLITSVVRFAEKKLTSWTSSGSSEKQHEIQDESRSEAGSRSESVSQVQNKSSDLVGHLPPTT